LAIRSPRRTRSQRSLDDALRHLGPPEPDADDASADGQFEDVEARAKRLGVTVEKVLREYARIAFADLRHIVWWDDEGLHVKARLSKADAAAIAEISTGTTGKGPVRVKLYDRKAALDAIARHLGMFTPNPRRQEENEEWAMAAEDAREELARWLARLAAERDEGKAAEDAAESDRLPSRP
jgi:hypothetical protein